MLEFVNGSFACERSNFLFVTQSSAPMAGGGGSILTTIVLAILLAAFLLALIFLYRIPGIGKSGKSKFLVYVSFAVFIIILGISGITYAPRIPFLGEFAGLIGLVAIVIALILGILIYITYRNEMDFVEEVRREGKDLQQKGDEIETGMRKMIEESSRLNRSSEEHREKADELMKKFKESREK